MKKLDPARLERLFCEIVKISSQNFLPSLMRVIQSDLDYPIDVELRLANVVSLLSAGISESAVLDLVQEHMEGIADVRMLELYSESGCLIRKTERNGEIRKRTVKPRDRVIVTDSNGNRFPGICVNINDFREPEKRYAVTLQGYHDLVFCSEAQIEFSAPPNSAIPQATSEHPAAMFSAKHPQEV